MIMIQMKRNEKRKVTKPKFTNASNKADLEMKNIESEISQEPRIQSKI